MALEDTRMPALTAAATSSPLTDVELVGRVRAGDARAMEPLMRRHNRTLYRTARAILRDDAEAEDAVQDAYIQAFRNLEAFRGDSSFSTWLVRIAANEALMRRRRNVRRSEVIPINHENGELLMEEIAQDKGAGPEQQTLGAEVRRLLEARIDALPDLYRAVFVMRAVEEMSVEETAAALELPPATVRTRFFRARALMRNSLEQEVDQSLLDVFSFAGARCDRIVAGVLARLAAA
jgi:RNA polymerase sigma-70 factor (ECF subfamily)